MSNSKNRFRPDKPASPAVVLALLSKQLPKWEFDLLVGALVFKIEAGIRLRSVTGCEDFDEWEFTIGPLKQILDAMDVDDGTIANLQWCSRDQLDLICGKDPGVE